MARLLHDETFSFLEVNFLYGSVLRIDMKHKDLLP
ncbi:Uncharacterised protein [Klebsiella pneumoniae]|nr:hypothetical protein AI2617V1_5056 [Serratia marcescens]CAH4025020.1 hypothetical protein AI2617V1_5056 [Serratia marcescens]SAS94918.1 Uncharacterised protein [Klebsiella pneumoniae]SYL25375.1 Uncharacterised protein [Klebsiella pneumoniae]SYN03781.1 Uncharacterised protein [Klebsiella pneumoniae]